MADAVLDSSVERIGRRGADLMLADPKLWLADGPKAHVHRRHQLLRFGICILVLCISGACQRNRYYWGNGRKNSVRVDDSKYYVLFKEGERDLLSESVRSSLRSVAPLRNLNTERVEPRPWAILSHRALDEVGRGPVLYRAPFLTTAEGGTFGISHLVHVKLLRSRSAGSEAAVTELAQRANEHACTVLGHSKHQESWYTLDCSAVPRGDALDVANALLESQPPILSAAVPDFLVDLQLNSCSGLPSEQADSPERTDSSTGACQNDETSPDQWALDNTGQLGGKPGVDIQACGAWKQLPQPPGDKVIVAVVDSGIDFKTHAADLRPGQCYDAKNGNEMDCLTPLRNPCHGTRCAGVVGATKVDGGVAGVAPGATLLSIYYDFHPSSSRCVEERLDALFARDEYLRPNSVPTLADAITWAWRDAGASVITSSWGCPKTGCPENLGPLDDAIKGALVQGRGKLGAIVVFAVGNASEGENVEKTDIDYPARTIPGVLAVGAITRKGERRQDSKIGAGVDLVAPGESIRTTGVNGRYVDDFSRTSAAAPHVAGIAALVLAANNHLRGCQVVRIIETNTRTTLPSRPCATEPTRPDAYGAWNKCIGYGLPDANNAVAAALNPASKDLQCKE